MREKLAEMMKKRGITSQADLARISGVPQPMISNILTGETKYPRIDTATKLAKALRCAVEDLYTDDDEKERKRA